MHQNALKSLLIVCATLLFVFAFSIAYKFVSNKPGSMVVTLNNYSNESLPTTDDDLDENPVYIGILRHTGLNGIASEKTRLNLRVSDFELTHFTSENNTLGIDPQIMFIEDTNFDYQAFVGKCVRAKIKILEYPNYSVRDAYMGIPVNITSLSFANNQSACKYYSQKGDPINAEYLTLSGTLKRLERPSPDVDYDYTLTLDEPYLDTNNAAGLNMYVKNIVIMPGSNSLWLDVENNIGKHVKIVGYFSWGFAESKYFRVTSIVPFEKQ